MEEIPDLAPPEEVDPFQVMLNDDLIYKVTMGSYQEVQYLLSQGADVNTISEEGLTPLTLAIERKNEEGEKILQALLEAGAGINSPNINGDAPIHVAVKFQNPKALWLLLSRGADFHLKNKDEKTPLQLARQFKNPEITQLIEDAHRIEKEREEQRLSNENFTKMLWNYSYYNCAQAYMRYYVESGQEGDVTEQPDYTLAAFKERHEKMIEYRSKIIDIFHERIDYKTLDALASYTQSAIYKELDTLVSNKYRRRVGVGKPSDLKKRCSEIADGWKLRPDDGRLMQRR